MSSNSNYQKIKKWFHEHPRFNPKSFTFDRAFRTLTSQSRLLPDFIIIGYHKTATTFLYEYLSQHPNIGAASEKEIHYFDYSYWRKTEWYRAQFPLKLSKYFFESKNKSIFKTGEATPLYVFHPKAAKRINELIPNAKFIVILRNPIDRAYSHYQHRVRIGLEEKSFEEAIEDDERRRKLIIQKFNSDEIRDYNVNSIRFPYVSIGKYVEHLKEWMNIFPREQILVLKTDDLNTEEELNKVCRFIGVPNFKFKNITKQNVGKYSEMNKETREKLIHFYKPYNEELEKFLDIKFNWD